MAVNVITACRLGGIRSLQLCVSQAKQVWGNMAVPSNLVTNTSKAGVCEARSSRRKGSLPSWEYPVSAAVCLTGEAGVGQHGVTSIIGHIIMLRTTAVHPAATHAAGVRKLPHGYPCVVSGLLA